MSKCYNEKEAEASHHHTYAKQSDFYGFKNEESQMENSSHPHPKHRLQVPSLTICFQGELRKRIIGIPTFIWGL